MFAHSFRSSKTFVTFIVSVAIFTDMILFSLIAPILPFALLDRVGLSPQDVQKWNSILLASYGGALMLGCCKLNIPRALGLEKTINLLVPPSSP